MDRGNTQRFAIFAAASVLFCGALFGQGAALPDGLVITEVMYHPAVPLGEEMVDEQALEFIEFMNVGTTPIQGESITVVEGIDIPLQPEPIFPGQVFLVVSDPAAFAERYGPSVRIDETFIGSLSNTGETLTFLRLSPDIISMFFFTYDDEPPWPAAAAGMGRSLELIDPASQPDPNDPASWRASLVDGGTPGVVPSDVMPPRVTNFSASALSVSAGDPLTLTWGTRGAESVQIEPQLGEVSTSGAETITIPANPFPVFSVQRLVDAESVWSYHDEGIDLGDSWAIPSFDDSGWAEGPAELGFGNVGRAATTLNRLLQPAFYFRKRFPVSALDPHRALRLRVMFDDGVIVFINGREAFRENLPIGPVGFDDLATASANEAVPWRTITIAEAGSFLEEGENVIAARVHNTTLTSSDIAFDLELQYAVAVTPQFEFALTATNSIGSTARAIRVGFEDQSGADRENDGLPDAWEMETFGGLGEHGEGDSDGDGFNNALEFRAGSDPTLASSIPRLEITGIGRSGSSLTFEITGAAGRTIGIEYSSSLAPGSWLGLGNAAEVDGVLSFTDPDPVRGGREVGYYRAFLR